MVYSTILLIIGFHTIFRSNGDWLTFLIGFVFIAMGVFLGEAIENKTNDRIKKLEKGNRNG